LCDDNVVTSERKVLASSAKRKSVIDNSKSGDDKFRLAHSNNTSANALIPFSIASAVVDNRPIFITTNQQSHPLKGTMIIIMEIRSTVPAAAEYTFLLTVPFNNPSNAILLNSRKTIHSSPLTDMKRSRQQRREERIHTINRNGG
jgi:hypothetical protein